MEDFTINHEFAKKYHKYRKAEEYQKLKARYGCQKDESSSTSSESEDDQAEAINAKLELNFFKTIACLKKRDPRIYDKDQKFFEDSSSSNDETSETGEIKSKKSLTLKDYERNVVLNHGGVYKNEEQVDNEDAVKSYSHELNEIKKSLIDVVKNDCEYSDDDLFKPKSMVSNTEEKSSIDKLDTYWQNPNLDKDEKFLRDYILQHKYLEDTGGYNSNEEDSSQSESDGDLFIKKQETFERKYNFRFEEPDTDFVKSFPRTVGDSVRQQDNKTKKKRKDRKERKDDEKRKKMEELKRLKQLKREEILEKIDKLREATGNADIKFSATDLDHEFAPDEYDQRMKELFDEEFYHGEEVEKPEFSDLDDEHWPEPDWDQYRCGDHDDQTSYERSDLPESEQPHFNMDCEFDPTAQRPQKRKNPLPTKRSKKKSFFYEAVAKKKPVYDPGSGSFERYLEEYYALDFEDLIGDLPCRFKYRNVPQQDFGLTTDEILSADNRTLNSWCSLKRVVQHRTPREEEDLTRQFARKARAKKKRHFQKPVLKPTMSASDFESPPTVAQSNPIKKSQLNSKQRRRKRDKEAKIRALNGETQNIFSTEQTKSRVGTKRRTQHGKTNDAFHKVATMEDNRLKAYGLKPKKLLKKLKYGSVSSKSKES